MNNENSHLLLSPPVIQHASLHGFTVSIEVNQLCSGRVEWGLSADQLEHTALASERGLVAAHEHALVIPVVFPDPLRAGAPVYYRVIAQPLEYETAYELRRGESEATSVRELQIPHADLESVTIAVANDTHEREDVIAALARRIDALNPDLIVWNGDACRSFNRIENMGALLLRPGANGQRPSDGGWASTRPLVYVTGNHDVRGEAARALSQFFVPGPVSGLPGNVALRFGPLAILTLDSGEDKPDHHPVFANTGAYEPYREKQSAWLAEHLQRAEISDAPFKIAFSHMPLRGLPGQNDGSTLIDHARFCGQGAALWLPQLIQAGVHAVISGHTHAPRCDAPTAEHPILQLVGGGPNMDAAALTVIEAGASVLSLRIENLAGDTLFSESVQHPLAAST